MNPRLAGEMERTEGQELRKAKWKTFLRSELQFQTQMRKWSEGRWREELRQRHLLSQNHDTFVSLDWPHYCSGATEACGGERGWCYTFSGSQASEKHREKVAYVDYVARKYPNVFAERVIEEINNHVLKGRLPYPNLRFSGSGEMSLMHVDALSQIRSGGVHLWGFTRNLRVAERLHEIGIAVLFSCDSTTDPRVLRKASELNTSKTTSKMPPITVRWAIKDLTVFMMVSGCAGMKNRISTLTILKICS